jgi:hypothetical protein
MASKANPLTITTLNLAPGVFTTAFYSLCFKKPTPNAAQLSIGLAQQPNALGLPRSLYQSSHRRDCSAHTTSFTSYNIKKIPQLKELGDFGIKA